jgi:hypothetical protein
MEWTIVELAGSAWSPIHVKKTNNDSKGLDCGGLPRECLNLWVKLGDEMPKM